MTVAAAIGAPATEASALVDYLADRQCSSCSTTANT